jgi:hypothetical protein
MSEIETNFTRVRTSKFNFRRPLSEEDWLWICLFAAVTHTRTQASRDHFLGQMNDLKEMFEKVAGPEWETKTVAPELPANVDPSNVYVRKPGDFDNLKESTTSILLSSAVNVILPALLGMGKAVLCTTDALGFLTTDAPSTWYDPTAYRRHPMMRSIGLAMPEIEITLPISPQQCLVFWHGEINALYLDLPSEAVDRLNHRHRAFAPSTIITCRNETRPKWFANVDLPADSWEMLHPDPKDRFEYKAPGAPHLPGD